MDGTTTQLGVGGSFFGVESLDLTLLTAPAQQEQLVAALRHATRLPTDRCQSGLDRYLRGLDAQRNLMRSERVLTSLPRQKLTSIFELNRALGGGRNQ